MAVEYFGQLPPWVLGSVAQSGGLPTGGLIERSANANGEYVRFADGTQICTFRGMSVDSQSAFGTLFCSPTTTWTYPASFAAVWACKAAPDSVFRWGSHGAPGLSSLDFRHISQASSVAVVPTNLLAIGRWF